MDVVNLVKFTTKFIRFKVLKDMLAALSQTEKEVAFSFDSLFSWLLAKVVLFSDLDLFPVT